MFILRLLVIAFIIGYVVWKINNKLLGKNLKLAQVIAATLVVISLVYLVLGILSYLIEPAKCVCDFDFFHLKIIKALLAKWSDNPLCCCLQR
jgi:predicted PurR-regulated permease PerM